MDDFIWRALLGGLGVAIVTGPLGCFVIWRRMAYFGDTLAHSALLGVAIGLWLHVHPTVGIIGICLVTALLLGILQQQSYLAVDTLLGILSHTALSLGLVAIAFLKGIRIDLYAYLFGDLLAVTATDLYWIYGGGSVLMLILMKLWQPLLSMTVHEELARIEGVAVVPVRLIFMLMMSLVIAAAMKIVGILLITSLLIIPAATARRFAQTPEQMAGLAILIGCLAVGLGLLLSLYGDTPTGPSVVVAASTLFTVTLLWKTE
ncbi:MAG: zinc ABC transporter permease [Beggiatoa sp. IS2]|nr:MAG: zinc ABC transporter permease [Beggiatoa sp. IS2]